MSSPANIPFFSDATRLGVLTRAAHGWRGTPFRANSADCGQRGGVCCHLLVTSIYRECGFDLGAVPFGAPGHARFSRESIMEPLLDAHAGVARVAAGEILMPGDLLGYRINAAIHHLAILLPGDQIVHAVYGAGCVITPRLDPTWGGRHAATWRPIA